VIAIFDYGAGNLRSVANTLEEIGAPYTLVATRKVCAKPPRSCSPASAISAR